MVQTATAGWGRAEIRKGEILVKTENFDSTDRTDDVRRTEPNNLSIFDKSRFSNKAYSAHFVFAQICSL